MICSETYYQHELIGKTPDEVREKIEQLKMDIRHLKRKMEHPDYVCTTHPSDDTRLWSLRLYLKRAKRALRDLGGVYTPTEFEIRAMKFDADIESISRVTLKMTYSPQEWCENTVDISKDHLQFSMKNQLTPVPELFEFDMPLTKAEFLHDFTLLNIGEWRRTYNEKRYKVSFPGNTVWQLKIEYKNGNNPYKCRGNNAYPYNFKALASMFAIELPERIEEDEFEEVYYI